MVERVDSVPRDGHSKPGGKRKFLSILDTGFQDTGIDDFVDNLFSLIDNVGGGLIGKRIDADRVQKVVQSFGGGGSFPCPVSCQLRPEYFDLFIVLDALPEPFEPYGASGLRVNHEGITARPFDISGINVGILGPTVIGPP
jgi:hypothetical protein